MTTKHVVEESGTTKLCLMCIAAGKSVEDAARRRVTRGLCTAHHKKWLRAKSKLSAAKQQELDAHLISERLLLPDEQGKRTASPNEFDLIVRELFSDDVYLETPTEPGPQKNIADDANKDINKKRRKKPPSGDNE